MSLLVGLISFVALAIIVPIAIRIRPQRNAIVTIIALAMAVHVVGTVAGAVLLPELDYWQNAAPYWFATIILLYAYGTCYRSLSVLMLLAISGNAAQTAISSWPSLLHSSSAICGANGEVMRTSGSASPRGSLPSREETPAA